MQKNVREGVDHYGPVDPQSEPDRWIETIRDYVIHSGELNGAAARWTALAVILGALSSVLTALSN
jgi:hypothetical protein